MKATEPIFEVIDEIEEIMREKEVLPGTLLVLTETDFLVMRENEKFRVVEVIQAGKWIDRIPYIEVQDIKFPSLKKIKKYGGKRYLFRVRTTGALNYQFALSKKSFFKVRSIFTKSLVMLEDETVGRDASDRTRLTLEWLQENPSSLALFDELVLKRGILTVNEFFGLAGPLQRKLETHFNDEVVARMMNFIAFEEALVDDQKVIILTKEDKDMLLDSFSRLREEFERQHFDRLGDRQAEEAEFWNNFFRDQKVERSFLWGGIGEINPRKAANNLPEVVASKLENLPVTRALDVYDNFQEVSNNEAAQRYLKVDNSETTALIRSINNFSLSLLSGAIAEGAAPIEQPPQPIAAPMQRPQSLTRPVSTRRVSEGPAPALPLQFRSFLLKAQIGFKRKLADPSLNALFQTSPLDQNEEIIKLIDAQVVIKMELDAEAKVGKDIYEAGFRAKYVQMHEKVTCVLRAFYTVLVVPPTEKSRQNVKEVLYLLSECRNEIKALRGDIKTTMDEGNFSLHCEPLGFLSNLIGQAVAKIQENGYS